DALLEECLGGPHQPVARHDDAVVGRDQVLLGAVADRPHAFLQRGVLAGKARHPAIGLAGLLGGAVHQIVVVLVGEGPVGAGYVFAVYAGTLLHGVDLALGERAHRMEIVGPGPAGRVVDRDPEVAVDRVVAARRDHGEGRHHPGRDAPIVIAIL